MKNSFPLLFLFSCAALVFPPNAVFAEDEECHCAFTGIEPESAPGKLCRSFEVLASATMTCSTELAPGESATTNVVVRHVSGEAPPESVGVTIKAKCIHGEPLSASGTIEIEYEDMEEDSDSGTGAGKDDKRLKSMHWQVSLGETASGHTAGRLVLESETMNAYLCKPWSLALKGSRVQDVLYEPGTSQFRQILANECLVDVTNSSAHGYGLRFYDIKDIVGLQTFYTCYDLDPLDESGYRPPITFADSPMSRTLLSHYDKVVTNEWYELEAQAQPFVSYTIENPDGSTSCDRLWITKLRSGLPTKVSEFSYQNELWSLSEEEDKTTSLAIQNDNGLTVKTWQVSGKNGVASMTRKTYATIGGRQLPVEIVDDPQGVARTTTLTYFTNATDTVNLGRLQTQVNPDGSWKSVSYDAGGRESEVRMGWIDGGPEDDCRLATYSYTPFLPTNYFPVGVPFDDGQTDWNTPRVETVSIAGIPISKTLRSVAMDAMDYRIIEEVRLLDPTVTNLVAAWEDSTNPHTFSKYMPENNSKPCSKLPELIIRPDGTTTHYDYIDGYCTNGVNGSPSDFVLVSGGPHFRTTITYGTKDSVTVSPDGLTTNLYCGVPGRTTREVTIATKAGNRELLRETYVCSAPDTYERVSWTTTSRDELGRVVATRSSDGTYTEKSWNGNLLAYEVGADGIRTDYTYDALGRRIGASAVDPVSGLTRQSLVSYDAEGRTLSSTISSVGLSQTSTNSYDGAGRLVWARSPDGLETAYDYGFTAAGLPYTSTIRGYGTALVSTNTTVRHKDGQIAYTEFNGVRKTTYAYGLDASNPGVRWTYTYNGPLAENSPVWTCSIYDALGRTIEERRPGFGGSILVTSNSFNTAGQLLSSTQSTIVGSVPSVLSVDLYSYDALGEAVVSAQDIDLDGQIDFAGPDIVSSNATAYVTIAGAWWQESRQYAFPDTGSAAPLLITTSRQRLSGLGGAYSADGASGVLAAESVSIDARSNQSTSRTVIDRGTATVYQIAQAPDSTIAALSVTVNGLLQTKRSNHGLTTSYVYDALGRMVAVEDARGGFHSRGYDASGRVAWESDPATNGTWYAYDVLGRQVAVTNALGHVIETAYDTEGHALATWGATYPVAYEYDSFGRMTSMYTYRGSEEIATQSQITSLKSQMDRTRWLYEEATGVLTNKVYADGKGTAYSYTPDGQLASRIWARGVTTTYTYTNDSSLAAIDYSDDTPDVFFQYDRLGRMTSAIVAGVSTNAYTYDQETMALSVETQNGIVIDRSTDALGRAAGFSVAGVGDPGSLYAVTYGYDTYGRFSSVSTSDDTFNYSYLSGSDLVSGMTASSGHSWSRSYEPARSLITAVENRFGNTVISRFDYVNDELGRRISRADSGQAFQNPAFDVYSYNTRSEVSGAQRYHGTNPADTTRPYGGREFGYAYDPIGNRLSASESVGGETLTKGYTANALNQYTAIANPDAIGLRGVATNTATVTVNGNAATRDSVVSPWTPWHHALPVENANGGVFTFAEIMAAINPPGTNTPDLVSTASGHVYVPPQEEVVTYDGDGNLLSDGRWQYTWNGENRLIKAEELVSPTNRQPYVVEYAYDHQGRMAWKTVASPNVPPFKNIIYLWDDFNIIVETTVADSVTNTTYNVWGLDLNGTMQGAGGVGGLIAVVKDSATYIPAWDANGNIMEYVGSDGIIAVHREYDPFGGTVVATGDANAFTHWFSTKPWCPVTCLSEYQFRKYSPVLGRWLSRDPSDENNSQNLNCFLENKPVLSLDIYGLSASKSCCCCCAENIYFVNIQKVIDKREHGTMNAGFDFGVRIDLSKVLLNGVTLPGTDKCGLAWEERTSTSYFSKYNMGQTIITQWENETWVRTSSPTFNNWWKAVNNMDKMDCPGWYNDTAEPIVLPDTPRLSAANPVREFHREFRITIKSAPGCPCEKASMTISARMSVFKSGEVGGNISSLTFTLL